MPVTEEPRGLNWINNVNTNAFGSLTSQLCWAVGSLSFTALACWLMTRQDTYEPVGAFIEGTQFRQFVMVSRETTRNLGNALATALLVAWGAKTVAGVVDSQNKRKASPNYVPVLEAKERGKVTGAAAALALKEAAKDSEALRKGGIPHLTAERQALDPVQPKPPEVMGTQPGDDESGT